MLEKYLYLDSRKGDDFSQLLENIIVMQRQLEHLSRKERVDDLARKHQEDKVVYSELLELRQELKWEVLFITFTHRVNVYIYSQSKCIPQRR